MSKVLKSLIKGELDVTLRGLTGGVFISYAGLNSENTYALRSSLAAEGVKMQVLPNRIAQKAISDLAFKGDDLAAVFKGETAMIFADSPIAAARAIKKRITDGVQIKVKGGFLEGEILDADKATRMADLPTREELFGQIAYCFQASAQRIAGCFQQTYKQIAGCFVSYKDELEEKGEAA